MTATIRADIGPRQEPTVYYQKGTTQMTYNAITTLNEILAYAPPRDLWEKLLAHLGKTQADDEPLRLLTVLDANGLDDALWCLRVNSLERLSRHFQAWCAEQVLHLFETARPGDGRVRDQISTLLNDDATAQERKSARAAASAAAWDAARDADTAAAWDAARASARGSAKSAAWDVVSASARGGEWPIARAAARIAQEEKLRGMIHASMEEGKA